MEKETKTEKESTTKKKLSIKKLIVAFLCVLLVILAIIFIIKLFNKKETYKDKATYSSSFFIKNNKGKYALFNESGKKITDFIFDSTSSFVNNSALVHKEKEGYSIINNKGKDVISYDKYNYISSYSGIYKVRSDKGYKLIDSKGKTILEAEQIDVSSYGDDYPFIIVTANNEIKVISYDAKTITTFKQKRSAKSPTVNHVGKIATVFYNGQNVVFNSKTKKIISKFKNKSHYCVNSVSEDEKIISLNACASWFETVSEKGHMLIIKGKVNDLSKKCDGLSLNNNIVICSSSNGENIVHIKGSKATVGEKINSRIQFIDDENYIIRNEKNYKIEFYKNGKKVKSMDASISASGKAYEDMYVLYVDNGYEFYDKSGKKAIKENYKYATTFDKNGNARVSKDGKTYYLINSKGKKISDEYKSLNVYDTYYLATNEKGLKGILNNKGKLIVETKYTSIYAKNVRDKNYIVASTEDDKYYLYDLDSNKLIKKANSSITINEHYIKVSSAKKTSYYTYKDKLIYEE